MIRKPNLAIMITVLLLLVLLLLAAPAAAFALGTSNLSTLHDYIGLYIAGSIGVLVLLAVTSLLCICRARLRKARHEIKASNDLLETFMNANGSMIYLKDENQRYIFINKAFEFITGRTASELIGKSDYEIFSSEFADMRGHSDLAALREKTVLVDEVQYKDKIYQTTKFPVTLNNGQTGLGAYVGDVTEERMLRRQQEKTLHRNKILLDVFSLGFESTQEQLDYVLNRALELTGSQYGILYFYDDQLSEFTLNAWTKGVMDDCEIIRPRTRYHLENVGIWGEAVRQASPVVVNDFHLPDPLKRGCPDGHIQMDRFMAIPVMVDGSIVAVVGLANKPNDYDDSDVYETTLLMSGAWQACERKQTQERLHLERNKYLQTLISIGDGVMVVDRDGKIEMLNNIAQNLTGWPIEEAQGRLYSEIFQLDHETAGQSIEDPIAAVLRTGQSQELDDHAIMVSRNGTRYNLEDSAAPVPSENGDVAGVVMVFRDATDKKAQQRKIEFLSFHDALTGLYNRRFFEEELIRIDTGRNLPITVVMGDVNGLKLTNDVFGHVVGDSLLMGVAEVLRKVCRADDIIARWGGDEFVMLLPSTTAEAAEAIISRVKKEFSGRQFMAIKGSISMGIESKSDMTTDMAAVLKTAEERMYLAKTLEQDSIRQDMIETIINKLHASNPRESEHSQLVSELCERFGRTLGMSEVEVRKLKDAGYLHDIGKVVLDPRLLNKNYIMTAEEWSEIKKHPITGYRILNTFDETVDLAEPVLAHQEHWDGTGYPKGLLGQEIPVLARIIALAEGYERLIHDSDDREAFSPEAAISHIRSLAGSQYDPELAELFARMLEE